MGCCVVGWTGWPGLRVVCAALSWLELHRWCCYWPNSCAMVQKEIPMEHTWYSDMWCIPKWIHISQAGNFFWHVCSSHHQIVIWICFWLFVKLNQNIHKSWDGNAVLNIVEYEGQMSSSCIKSAQTMAESNNQDLFQSNWCFWFEDKDHVHTRNFWGVGREC